MGPRRVWVGGSSGNTNQNTLALAGEGYRVFRAGLICVDARRRTGTRTREGVSWEAWALRMCDQVTALSSCDC